VISGRDEDVIVQKEPAPPVYCEHSFVAWSGPFLLFLSDADTDATPVLSARVRATKPAITTDATRDRRWIFMRTPPVAAGLRRPAHHGRSVRHSNGRIEESCGVAALLSSYKVRSAK
jgi:hypothetical protein